MKERRVSAQQRANKTALISYGVMNFILIACYLLEVIKKSRTVGYFAVFCILAIVPWLISLLIYKKNQTSELIQYTIPIGFCIFYLFIIFTTISPVAYVYAFIIAIVLIPMGNIKVTGEVGVIIGKLHEMAQELSGMRGE